MDYQSRDKLYRERLQLCGESVEEGKEGRRGNKGLLSRMRGEKHDSFSEASKARRIDNDLDNIPIIPDLEEVMRGELHFSSSGSSQCRPRHVYGLAFKQLEKDAATTLRITTCLPHGEIDLKVLTSVLAPEKEIKELDVEWRWDGLFAQVSAEISSEKSDQIEIAN